MHQALLFAPEGASARTMPRPAQPSVRASQPTTPQVTMRMNPIVVHVLLVMVAPGASRSALRPHCTVSAPTKT